ncbi:sigma-54-dependent Fis family transcriptional regulator [Geodermatophilus ruber]|uniref:Transcriptional regulator of acetoin/glycerol metabolism n=1 Tax=Geodermatophilus ruber TaxID=504800 RepID=A0A1I4KCR9_9ACTN|nr:GAF domain-containing protein [Geodermatophilus ruber]SFL76528.1 Transcriptional regulator of acetoin/glycerol metabolism [Geodermatophilus ruber]
MTEPIALEPGRLLAGRAAALDLEWTSLRGGPEPGGPQVARARMSFLGGETVGQGVVRQPILASWTRSRLWEVDPDRLDLLLDADLERDTLLTRAAEPVLRDIADLFATEPVSVILCDAKGVVLSRRTGDSGLEQHLDRVWLAPGFSYAEEYVGTNGIGTALEGRRPAQVFGHEHYVEHLEDLACAGVPIRHPMSGKVLGVVDLTCWRRDAGPLMVATAGTLAQRVEQVLLRQSGRGELAVLNDYLVACRRNRGPVLALGEDLLMLNDRARELLDPADQEPLLAEAWEALGARRRHPLVLDLPSGRTARVYCRPTVTDRGVVGGVLDIHLTSPGSNAGRPSIPRPRAPLATAVGSSPAWTKCWQAVDRHLQAREWLVLAGEAGSGKTTLVRGVHQGRSPAASLRVLSAEDFGPRWSAEIEEELATSGGTLVIRHVDRLSARDVDELAEVLEPCRESADADRPWVVATVTTTAREPAVDLSRLLACFPRTIDVPPLRHHVEDVAELVPHLLARLAHGPGPTCPPEILRVLMHNRWPGNVEQLVQVLRKVVAKRRAGPIELRDLPTECLLKTRRLLSPLELLECDAIVGALVETGGSKVEAARRLAMSRATIYRKIRDYGIAVLPSGAVGQGG